jgi:hypothetical protein
VKLVHVPTVQDLVKVGLAQLVSSKPDVYEIRKKGYARIHAAEAHNAEVMRAMDAEVEAAHKPYLKALNRRRKLIEKRKRND